ncbi:hypothetical protein APX70_200095 [Pseudomonas syringae pv. maculicola]|uniref:Uncharacterized protein n=1 Tax=Pseudomonas syringae pv. maculicola TaxID=59511 RepID=A0A3M2X235_PSEYM|nr:hypothetical protein APX70_200095 [Pseudomonas syringae pv. maculicola]
MHEIVQVRGRKARTIGSLGWQALGANRGRGDRKAGNTVQRMAEPCAEKNRYNNQACAPCSQVSGNNTHQEASL